MVQNIWQIIDNYMEKKWFIISLIIINLVGSIYGFYWYKNQLGVTDNIWIIFVPDSPLSSTFFTLFLIFYYFGRKSPFIEAMGAITSFKYGLWAVIVILWGAWERSPSINDLLMINSISWIDVMLMVSHLGMALEALLFYRKYSFKFFSILLVGFWIFTNDYFDYTKDIHPWLPKSIQSIDYIVGEYTLYLSGLTLLIFYFLSILRKEA